MARASACGTNPQTKNPQRTTTHYLYQTKETPCSECRKAIRARLNFRRSLPPPPPQRSKVHEIIQLPPRISRISRITRNTRTSREPRTTRKNQNPKPPKSPHATNPKPTPPECRKITPVSQQKKVKKEKNDPPLINPLYLCIVKRTVKNNTFS